MSSHTDCSTAMALCHAGLSNTGILHDPFQNHVHNSFQRNFKFTLHFVTVYPVNFILAQLPLSQILKVLLAFQMPSDARFSFREAAVERDSSCSQMWLKYFTSAKFTKTHGCEHIAEGPPWTLEGARQVRGPSL